MSKVRRKKKSKRNKKLIAVCVIIAVIGILLSGFYVRDIEVTGNQYTDKSEILKLIDQGISSKNYLAMQLRNKLFNPEYPGSISSVEIQLTRPWSVCVKVKEKEIIGSVLVGEEYFYFDKEGVVVYKNKSVMDGIPVIEKAEVKKTNLYQVLEIEDKKVLKAILNVAMDIRELELSPDHVVYTENGMELQFGTIKVILGESVTTEKMAQIPPILSKLTGKSGTLHLEHFEGASNSITFKDDVPEEPEESDSQEEDGSDYDYSDEYYGEDGYSDYDYDYGYDYDYDDNYDYDYGYDGDEYYDGDYYYDDENY